MIRRIRALIARWQPHADAPAAVPGDACGGVAPVEPRPSSPLLLDEVRQRVFGTDPEPGRHPFQKGDIAAWRWSDHGDMVVFEVARAWWSYLGPGKDPVPMVTEIGTTPDGKRCQYHYRADACELLQGDRS